MPKVSFTRNLQRHVECPTREVKGATVREAMDAYFAEAPRARDYVLDEQGAVRKHVVLFINGQQLEDRVRLSDALKDGDEVHVMQALSGG
jgi:molybdopterin converting factor small subunit